MKNNSKVRADTCDLCRIELDHVGVTAGADVLLKDVSFHIHCGQLTALVGPNGAGKTTLIRAILGQRPHTGQIRHVDAESVWIRPLVGKFTAVALVNRYPFAREIKLPLGDVGIGGECWARDLWTQKCEGKHSGFYFATIPPHATKLLKLRPVDCPKCD